MLSIQNFSKVIYYAIAIIFTISLGFFIRGFVSPPIELGRDDQSRNYIRLELELNEATRLNRASMEQIFNLRREVEARGVIIADLRSNSKEGFNNNLQVGDIIIEAGILTDESILLLQELGRRLAKDK